MRIKINSLRLRDFMGIKQFELNVGGHDATVYGANGVGKSTLASAYQWLLFGKDSDGRADFDIKPRTPEGDVIPGTEPTVEAELDVNGDKLMLRRVYREVWTKKRGEAQATLTGNTTDYSIDGVPVQKKEYDAAIAALGDEEVFKLLTNPKYFAEQLHWKVSRDRLMEVCGDISDADVIASDKQLARLPEILGKRTLEQHKKVIAARRSEINKELERIPVRISEVERGLPDISGLVPEKLDADIARLQAEQRELEQQLARIENGGEAAEVRKQIAETETAILNLKNELRGDIDKRIANKRQELHSAIAIAQSKELEIAASERAIANHTDIIERLQGSNDELRQEWQVVNARECTHSVENVCPYCEQDLPAEKIKAAREKALAMHNREKAEELERINSEGKRNNERIAEWQDIIGRLSKEKVELCAERDMISRQADTLQAELDELTASVTDITTHPEYTKLTKAKVALQDKLTQLQSDQSAAMADIKSKVAQARADTRTLETSKLQIEQRKQGEKRITELMAQERELATEIERLEQELYLTEQFTRAKVSMLEERINSRFAYARFRLFNPLINGGLEEICEITTVESGAAWGRGLNKTGRVNAGVDIINTLGKHYGFSAPIFVDDREGVFSLVDVDAQVINLVAKIDEKELRTEVVK